MTSTTKKLPITFYEAPQHASWANYYLTLYVSPCNLLWKTSAWDIYSVSVFPTVTANGRKRNNMSTVAYLLFVIRIQFHAFWVGPTHKAILRTSTYVFVCPIFPAFPSKIRYFFKDSGQHWSILKKFSCTQCNRAVRLGRCKSHPAYGIFVWGYDSYVKSCGNYVV